MLALIEQAMNGPHDAPLRAIAGRSRWPCTTRLGDFPGCVEWSEKVRAADHLSAAARTASADLLIAMSDFKLRRSNQARAAFEDAERRAEKDLFKAGEGDLDSEWVEDWLVYQTLHREAAALIGPATAPAATQAGRP